ncbi:cob(I)yrinic acid a,c-diamide adenosyltransferase [Desulfitobacterium chlororespirans]|uniref:cob(I)yrinic acid a,c-diamide adenosyltransferase n=1 Tax=Desulfitobacterium chlororespirans TaxID=51616 RepID=UPI0009324464|nr:cob(I)yrinic acid a,c-diamide adenosyltransferase [Desulfitobacterium chlororespirans]
MKTEKQKGLVIVHTGDGKGKTTAAFGLGMRAWGQGLKVLVIQFIKGQDSGELRAAEKLGPSFTVYQMGEGFVRDCDEKAFSGPKLAAEKALQTVEIEIKSGKWDMIILDEINCAVICSLISEEAVLALIDNKPSEIHLVLTGIGAKPQIIEKADLVSEMREIRHPFRKGVKAQKGIEF